MINVKRIFRTACDHGTDGGPQAHNNELTMNKRVTDSEAEATSD